MKRLHILTVCFSVLSALLPRVRAADAAPWLSPAAMVASPDGSALYVCCATGNRVVMVDVKTGKIAQSIDVPPQPTGVAVSPDGLILWVTCGGPDGQVAVVDIAAKRVVDHLPAGHTPGAPVAARGGKNLYVCNRFNNDVSFLDLAAKKESCRVKVRREPVAAALTPDDKFLLVANLLHDGPADADDVAAVLSVIDTAAAKVVKELKLPNGSGSLNDIRISPDGKLAAVTHVLSRFHLPTTQLDRGWINTNALTLVDITRMEVINTVLLDNVDQGAANPWGVAWSADGKSLVVTHAGTHEISVIEFPALLAKLAKAAGAPASGQTEVANDLAFLVGVRQRLALPPGDRGPRAVAMLGNIAYVANYFSDTLGVVDTAAAYPKWESIPLGPKPQPNAARKGEEYFNDASICFQGWQSCASCHPGDARVDALNWDMLNDGIGNPKNNKSLLLALSTPPSMSLGVRETGEMAVRAGIRHSLFTVQPPVVADSMDAYLKSLRAVPSPRLQNGGLSKAAMRGEKIFKDGSVGCAHCHPAGLLTDLRSHDVGTVGKFDKKDDHFDTPTLVETWRTAPYLHDGSAATIRDVLTTHNRDDNHGNTSGLNKDQLDDLIEYVESL